MVQLFGIRHHGPGSARSLRRALETFQPELVLVEGPPEADAALALLSEPGMEPPVALLLYVPETPQQAVYYPFVSYSPEWQAIRYAQERAVPVRFMDLPQAHRFAELAEHTEPVETPEAEQVLRRDPLQAIAEAAGYPDGEDWWEQFVEHRGDAADQFAGIAEIMGELRAVLPPDPSLTEQRREAWMRQTIRKAQAEGFERIAVVCGAFHVPALQPDALTESASTDTALLTNLPKSPVATTWVPWTFGRLSATSGYGAGVRSPAWYQRLWESPKDVAVRWLSDAAALLREADLPASTASVIEAVRLAEALAALRDRPLPTLPELHEAARAVLCNGYDAPMALIEKRLIVGERLGSVPESTPMLPLPLDLRREQKRLRLEPTADHHDIELDLRKDNDLARSQLLHRLRLLEIPWGTPLTTRGKGTFKEGWRLQWQPEFAVRLIEANLWGRTVATATSARVVEQAERAQELPVLTGLVEDTLQAELPEALAQLLARLESLAAVTSDIPHLMEALPPLARVTRYGNVRQTDTAQVGAVVEGLLTRICVGLPAACGALNDEAASAMYARLLQVHQAVGLLQAAPLTELWNATLMRLADREGLHGLLAGACARLLLDQELWDAAEVSRRLSVALSRASDPIQAAAWLEGLLRDSGELLLHTDTLWEIADGWLSGLSAEGFLALLPLLRRTFTTFSPPLRRALGERVKHGPAPGATTRSLTLSSGLDPDRARRPLPLVARLLGLNDGLRGLNDERLEEAVA